MNGEVKITVYIASHNYGRFLKAAIESVLRQNFDSWELLIINDNSSDNTQEIMELYAGDERIKIFKTDGILLPAVANFALKRSKGKYLIRLDADDVFDENILLVLSNYLDRHPQYALVFPDYYLMDEKGGIYAQERRIELFQFNHTYDIPAHGACTMIRKRILEKLGGYREDLGAQDGFDLWSKVIEEYECGNINLPLFYYRQHGSNLTTNKHRIFSARRTIKRDAVISKLNIYKPITAIIPCREKYDLFPNFWSKEADEYGNTFLDLSIQRCIGSRLFDNIVVTCDNNKVLEIMEKYNDSRLQFIRREADSTLRSRPIVETLNNILKKMNLPDNGIMVLNYNQAPFMTTETINEAIYTLILNDAQSSFGVEELDNTIFKRSPHGLVALNNYSKIRSEFDTLYRDSRAIMALLNSNIKRGSLSGTRIVNFVVPKKETFFIQTKEQYNIALILNSFKRKTEV